MSKFISTDEVPRKEEIRDKRQIRLPIKITDIRKYFNENLKEVKNKFKIANKLQDDDIQQAEEIWRSQIVFLESALDYYLHEIVKYGLIKIFNSDWEEKTHSKSFKLSFSLLTKINKNPEQSCLLLKEEIDRINSANCFLGYEKMVDNLKMVGLSLDNALRNDINKLYSRRNKIAHQSDRNPENSQKFNITENDVKYYIDIVEKLVDHIDKQIIELNKK